MNENLDDWQREYTAGAVCSMLVFIVHSGDKTHTSAMKIHGDFKASVAVETMSGMHPGEIVLPLGICRAVETPSGALTIEARLNPEYVRSFKSGELDKGSFEYMMKVLGDFLERDFPKGQGLLKMTQVLPSGLPA